MGIFANETSHDIRKTSRNAKNQNRIGHKLRNQDREFENVFSLWWRSRNILRNENDINKSLAGSGGCPAIMPSGNIPSFHYLQRKGHFLNDLDKTVINSHGDELTAAINNYRNINSQDNNYSNQLIDLMNIKSIYDRVIEMEAKDTAVGLAIKLEIDHVNNQLATHSAPRNAERVKKQLEIRLQHERNNLMRPRGDVSVQIDEDLSDREDLSLDSVERSTNILNLAIYNHFNRANLNNGNLMVEEQKSYRRPGPNENSTSNFLFIYITFLILAYLYKYFNRS